MSKKENHQPCLMIADKRSIAINPLATDPADLESEIFHFSTIFSFSVIYFSTPRGHPRTPETPHTLRASILVDRAGFEPAAFRSPEENFPHANRTFYGPGSPRPPSIPG